MKKSTKILLIIFVILLIIGVPYSIWAFYQLETSKTPNVTHFVCNDKICKIMIKDIYGKIVEEQPINRNTMDGFGVPNCLPDASGTYMCNIWIYEKQKKIGGYHIGAIPVIKLTVTPVERSYAKDQAKLLNGKLKEQVLDIDITIPETEFKEKKFFSFGKNNEEKR